MRRELCRSVTAGLLLRASAIIDGALLAGGPAWGQIASPSLAAGTRLRVQFDTTVDTSNSRAGDLVQARLIEPVKSGNTELLPIDTIISGKVRDARKANIKFGLEPMLRLEFYRLDLPDGRTLNFGASAADLGISLNTDSEGVTTRKLNITKKDVAAVMIAAGAGAGIGAAAGGPFGRGAGAGIDSLAAGLGAVLVISIDRGHQMKGRDFKLKSGGKAWLLLDHDLVLAEPPLKLKLVDRNLPLQANVS